MIYITESLLHYIHYFSLYIYTNFFIESSKWTQVILIDPKGLVYVLHAHLLNKKSINFVKKNTNGLDIFYSEWTKIWIVLVML